MGKFKTFLSEEYSNLLLLEAKIDDFANRWMKFHAEHPTVKRNPDQARELIKHAFSLGQNPDEHLYITNQYLNGVLKPKEDDPTLRDSLGMWRKIVQRNLHGGKKLSEFDHDSLQRFFTNFPDLRKTQKKAALTKELAPYHIGQILHPQHGPLDVYHIQSENVKDEKEYEIFQKAMKTACTIPGSTVCVQHDPDYVRGYSSGHGFFAYLNKEGTFVLGHGHRDRGIVRHNNQVLQGDEHRLVADQTEKLLKSPHQKVIYKLAVQSPSLTDQEIQDTIEHKDVLDSILDSQSSERINKFITPNVIKKVMHSDISDSHAKERILSVATNHIALGHENSEEIKNILASPELADKLIEQGQSHILFNSDYTHDLRRNGIVAPKNYKQKVIDAFMKWTPKTSYQQELDPDLRKHKKEEDMAKLAENDANFTIDDFKHMIDHPNFGPHHGYIASHVLNAATSNRDVVLANLPLFQKALQMEVPRVHALIIHRASHTGSPLHDLITPEVAQHILNTAHKHSKDLEPERNRSTEHRAIESDIGSTLATLFSTSRDVNKRSENSDNLDQFKGDMISKIIHSNSELGKKAFLDRLPVATGGGYNHDILSPSELEHLAQSSHPRLRAIAVSSANTPEHILEKTLVDIEHPHLMEAAFSNLSDFKRLKQKHVDMFWDALKKNHKKLYELGDRQLVNPLHNLVDRLSNLEKQPGLNLEKIRREGLHHENAVIARSFLKHISSPEDISAIIQRHLSDESITGKEGGTESTAKRYLFLNLTDWAHGNSSSSPVFKHITPEHLVSLASRPNWQNWAGISNLYSHPKMPGEFLESQLKKLYGPLSALTTDRSLSPEVLAGTTPASVRSLILEHPNISDKMIKESLSHSRQLLDASKPVVSTFHNRMVWPEGVDEVFSNDFNSIAKNPKLSGETLDELVDQFVQYRKYATRKPVARQTTEVLLHNKNLQDRHVRALVEPVLHSMEPQHQLPPEEQKFSADMLKIKNPQTVQTTHAKHMADIFPNSFGEILITNKNVYDRLSADTIKMMLKPWNNDDNLSRRGLYLNQREAFLKHPNMSSKDLFDVLDNQHSPMSHVETAQMMMLNPNMTSEHVTRILEDFHKHKDVPLDVQQQRTKFIENLVGLRTLGGTIGGPPHEQAEKEQTLMKSYESKLRPEHIPLIANLGQQYHKPLMFSSKLPKELKEHYVSEFEKEKQKPEYLKSKDDPNFTRIESQSHGSISNLLRDRSLEREYVDRIAKVTNHKDANYIMEFALQHPNISPSVVDDYLLNPKHSSGDFTAAFKSRLFKNKSIDKDLSGILLKHMSRNDLNAVQKLRTLGTINTNLYNKKLTSPENNENPFKPEIYEAISRTKDSFDAISNYAHTQYGSRGFMLHFKDNPYMTKNDLQSIAQNENIHPKIREGAASHLAEIVARENRNNGPDTQYALRA